MSLGLHSLGAALALQRLQRRVPLTNVVRVCESPAVLGPVPCLQRVLQHARAVPPLLPLLHHVGLGLLLRGGRLCVRRACARRQLAGPAAAGRRGRTGVRIDTEQA